MLSSKYNSRISLHTHVSFHPGFFGTTLVHLYYKYWVRVIIIAAFFELSSPRPIMSSLGQEFRLNGPTKGESLGSFAKNKYPNKTLLLFCSWSKSPLPDLIGEQPHHIISHPPLPSPFLEHRIRNDVAAEVRVQQHCEVPAQIKARSWGRGRKTNLAWKWTRVFQQIIITDFGGHSNFLAEIYEKYKGICENMCN